MEIEMVQHALNFAARGWRVLPCECKGKIALLAGWPERATCDPTEVKALWHRHPEANIGIATGRGSGIFVLDVDGPKGTESLLEWERKGLLIPDTLRAKTGKGFHFYFVLPDHVSIRNSASKLAPGLDLRGDGGYVIAPPSVHESGHQYVFDNEDAPIVSAPEWLLQMLVQPASSPAHANATAESLTEIIPEGQRNATLMSLAGTMQRRGMVPAAIEAALLAQNSQRCHPPLPQQEVLKIATNVCRYQLCGKSHGKFAPNEDAPLRRADLLPLAMVEAKEVEWLWKPYLALSTLAMLSGDPGAGKTFVALAIAADVTAGRITHLSQPYPPSSVLYLSLENSPEYVLRPRFDSLDGNPELFYLLRGAVTESDKEPQTGSVRLSDVLVLQDALRRTKARLVIVDPIQSYLGADVDAHRSNETRPVMDGLSRLAEEHRCCILLVRHLSKARTGKALYQGLGSIDLTGAVRTELLAGCSPDDPNQRAIVQVKSNLAEFGPSLGYTIEGDGIFRWTGESHLTAAAILAPELSGEETGALAEAETFLFTSLAQGPLPATDIQSLAEQQGISPRTLRRAKDRLKVRSLKSGMPGGWEWSLPEGVQQ